MHTTRLVLIAALTLSAPTVSGEMYTWKDAEGRTHFGDKPPPEMREQAQEIEAKAYAPGSDENTRGIYQRTNRMFDAKEKLEREEKQRNGDQATRSDEMRKEACRQARDRARRLHGPVVFVDDEGREVRTTDIERKQKLQETQEWIAGNCS